MVWSGHDRKQWRCPLRLVKLAEPEMSLSLVRGKPFMVYLGLSIAKTEALEYEMCPACAFRIGRRLQKDKIS